MTLEFTHDAFLNGKLKITQSKSGYRFSIDAILLAHHADVKPDDRIVDIGTGCGIISLILAYRQPDSEIFGVEIQKDLAEIAKGNIVKNNLQHRIHILHCDAKTLMPTMTGGAVNMVICNPPHREADSGRINPNPQLAVARHEIAMTAMDLIRVAHRMLHPGGKFLAIYPARRMVGIMEHMRAHRIEPKKIRMIHSKADENGIRCLIEGLKGGKPGLTVLPPLIIYNKNGGYTQQVQKIFAFC